MVAGQVDFRSERLAASLDRVGSSLSHCCLIFTIKGRHPHISTELIGRQTTYVSAMNKEAVCKAALPVSMTVSKGMFLGWGHPPLGSQNLGLHTIPVTYNPTGPTGWLYLPHHLLSPQCPATQPSPIGRCWQSGGGVRRLSWKGGPHSWLPARITGAGYDTPQVPGAHPSSPEVRLRNLPP